jgi:hypothetical protein
MDGGEGLHDGRNNWLGDYSFSRSNGHCWSRVCLRRECGQVGLSDPKRDIMLIILSFGLILEVELTIGVDVMFAVIVGVKVEVVGTPTVTEKSRS